MQSADMGLKDCLIPTNAQTPGPAPRDSSDDLPHQTPDKLDAPTSPLAASPEQAKPPTCPVRYRPLHQPCLQHTDER